MRIIAGEYGGRTLLPPVGETTRPITDRAKQSLFDILAPLIPDSTVYDCFSGTGSMGLECLSRGATFCNFFERDRSALARLSQNIAAVRAQDRSRVIAGDIFKWFDLAAKRPESTNASGADLVFLDPPYRFLVDHADEILQLTLHLASTHLRAGAYLILRHGNPGEFDLPGVTRTDTREYGQMRIEIFRAADKS